MAKSKGEADAETAAEAKAAAAAEAEAAEADQDEPDGPPQESEGDDYRPEVNDGDEDEEDEAAATASNIEILTNKVKYLQGKAVAASDRGDPETLSRTLMHLARVNSALGRNAAYAKYIARNADRAARRHRASLTLDFSKKQAVNKSELQAELDSSLQFRTASEALLMAEQADDLCFRTDTFLKMSQSRLSLIKGDIKNA